MRKWEIHFNFYVYVIHCLYCIIGVLYSTLRLRHLMIDLIKNTHYISTVNTIVTQPILHNRLRYKKESY